MSGLHVTEHQIALPAASLYGYVGDSVSVWQSNKSAGSFGFIGACAVCRPFRNRSVILSIVDGMGTCMWPGFCLTVNPSTCSASLSLHTGIKNASAADQACGRPARSCLVFTIGNPTLTALNLQKSNKLSRRLRSFKRDRNTLANADAHCCQGIFATGLLQLKRRRPGHTRPGPSAASLRDPLNPRWVTRQRTKHSICDVFPTKNSGCGIHRTAKPALDQKHGLRALTPRGPSTTSTISKAKEVLKR